MEPEAFKTALAASGLRTGEFAKWVGCDRRTVQRWAKHGAPAFVPILLAHLQCEKPLLNPNGETK